VKTISENASLALKCGPPLRPMQGMPQTVNSTVRTSPSWPLGLSPGALAFYADLLGWESPDKMPMGERGDYLFVTSEDRRIGAISPWLDEGQQPMWLFYFGVDDIGRAHAAAKANGGGDVGDPHEVPGGDRIFTATDPGGARIAFVGKKGA
jgi:predicted enzyme related to lactoylglutathione lyase